MSQTVGTVFAVQANFYRVVCAGRELLCTRRANLKKMGQIVCVGDRTVVEEIYGDRGVISAVLPRLSYLERPAIANLNRILLVCALCEPDPDPWQISRFLVHAELAGVEILVGLSKADLVSSAYSQAWSDRLRTWGYDSCIFSSRTGEGITELLGKIGDGITLLTGQSGVGKSSLINYLLPHLHLSTQSLSPKAKTGRHTTRHVQLFPLPNSISAYLADSPGFLQPQFQTTPTELARAFPEIRHRLQTATCEFADCQHQQEPNCVVRGDWERYTHYLAWLEELPTKVPPLTATTKIKSAKYGTERRELLLSKQQRQMSRRRLHQSTSHEAD
jgi:ribosome small subunit-dependent GTPase A